ncbi:MAG: DUF2231 domain-containing protein [Gemmatimonadales bacterium]|nr:DUF2231 domain-containing protein [Gemmatimonadales bacterium]NIN11079.1 DUF2231 domain-containing protein [Gemmatimonadales bacterium]NIN49676.1 DUF2231 domain-containing protein [Gemmatimonadales bacterium]NIP07140.1 DUF2231 domain-containing protein [Gemmatimonadales bacterium]NIQ99531.1 DUF2231 domain-containing protein [Gemmatimonadales bacterium]
MLPETAAQWHAALNDFPSILFILALAFDLVGEATKRDSLRATGFWLLVVGAAGTILALVSGLIAEESIEHGGSVHLVMERHETLAISVAILFGVLAAWRIWRKGNLRPKERPTYLTISAVGVLAVLWTAHVGGTIVYGYGGGVPTPVLEGALAERAAGHAHEPGEEHDDNTAEADSSAQGDDHTDPPGTPEHEHE